MVPRQNHEPQDGFRFLLGNGALHSHSCFREAGRVGKPGINVWWSEFARRVQRCEPHGRHGHVRFSHKEQQWEQQHHTSSFGWLWMTFLPERSSDGFRASLKIYRAWSGFKMHSRIKLVLANSLLYDPRSTNGFHIFQWPFKKKNQKLEEEYVTKSECILASLKLFIIWLFTKSLITLE